MVDTRVVFDHDRAVAAGRIGGRVVTEKRRVAARLRELRKLINRVGVLSRHQQFLLNFLDSGDSARSQVVEYCKRILDDLEQCDQEKVGGSRARIMDVLLKATEHQHGRAPIKIQSLNINLDLEITSTDKEELLEQLKRS